LIGFLVKIKHINTLFLLLHKEKFIALIVVIAVISPFYDTSFRQKNQAQFTSFLFLIEDLYKSRKKTTIFIVHKHF